MERASLAVIPLPRSETSARSAPSAVRCLSSVPVVPNFEGLASDCITRTQSDISTEPSRLASPYTLSAAAPVRDRTDAVPTTQAESMPASIVFFFIFIILL